jgi:L-ascorbate metabolism protein UlaG (beta-lactamase superfamily)
MVSIAVESMEGCLAEELAGPSPTAWAMTLWWLGQAGFAVRCGDSRLLIDPYLSDFLSRKYAGKEFPHVRMTPAPVSPQELPGLDAVLCSHAHSDHMDPGTLPVVAACHPICRFMAPRAEAAAALERGVPEDRMVAADAGETADLGGMEIHVLPAAHEELKVNGKGEHLYLGFVLRYAGMAVYHSGDTVPFDGLAGLLRAPGVGVALLPVNGRDEYRSRRGVAGNMTLDEAIDLPLNAGIRVLIPHHFGMFEFNTTAPQFLRHRAAQLGARLRCLVPDLQHRFAIQRTGNTMSNL